MSKSPNILYIFTDQQTADAMSCADNADVHTPNMDRLAARGVRFTDAYCSFPLCIPSRMSMLTGLYPHQFGIDSNNGAIPDDRLPHTMGRLLRDAGYDCGWGGKTHIGPGFADGSVDFGFHRYADWNDFDLPDATATFIRRQRDRPFFAVACFDNPHNICEHGRDQLLPWGEVDDVPADQYPPLPTNFAEQPTDPEPVRLYHRDSAKTQRFEEFDETRWRKYCHVYYRLVEKVDAGLGVMLDALDDAGLTDDTLIVFSSDHGEMAGSHGSSHKQVLYRESTGVPLIVAGPGVRQGATDDALVVNGIDLLPTFCDYADAATPDDLPGRSLRTLLTTGDDPAWRDHLAVETRFGPAGPSGGSGVANWTTVARMIRTRRFVYHLYDWGNHREQLYDVEADPGEMTNLADDARFADQRDRHRRLLANWCLNTGDRFGSHGHRPEPVGIPGLGYVSTPQ